MSADKIISRNPWFWRAVICMTALFALSSIPDDLSSDGPRILFLPPAWHNLLHIPAYAVLTALWWRTLRTRQWPVRTAIATAIVIATAYGALDEVHQYFVPGRFLSLTDVGLNLTGALIAGAWALTRDRGFRPPPPGN